MVRKSLFVVLLLGVSYLCFAQIPDGPYLGQTPPGSVPEIFAPGLISLPDRRETKIVFSPDGQECFINAGGILLYTKQEDGHWLTPDTADFLGSGGAVEPFITADGQKLFMVRNYADIWMSTKTNGEWSIASKVASPVSTSAEEWHPTVTSDGTLYFCSTRNGPYNIYRSRLEDGQYKEVERLDSTINSPLYGAWDPYIAPDESYMIFSSERPDGYGSTDQYISYYNEGSTWSYPQNLGSPINTSEIEYGSYVSYDGKYYFFSRPLGWGNAPADIYWVDTSTIPAGINDFNDLSINFELNQNYPNPFHSSTTISYSISKPSFAELKIYDALGNEVRTLVKGFQTAGNYDIPFEAKNLSAGVYFYKLEIDNNLSKTKKMLFLR
jgi:hypothetical protein